MTRLLAKLLILLSMLVMPLGMGAAAPAAEPVTHHAMAAGMQHCPDQGAPGDATNGVPECAMGCAAALPALVPPQREPPALPCQPAQQARTDALPGLHPETATPPPRLS